MPTLQWLSREEDLKRSGRVPYRLLEEAPELGYGDPRAGNMLIQGDNLEALKALLPFYGGQVKCIFIDPPYNTRSAFEHYDDNLEHAQWLGMMYPRLELLRELLREDGSIWVTIDDHEGQYLKVVMDEVFGRGNFITSITWQKRTSPANDAKYFSTDHDNVLVYARQKTSFALNRLHRTNEQSAHYKNPDNDPRGPWNSVTYTGNKTRAERPNLYYPIRNPNTGNEVLPPKTLTWRYGADTHKQNEAESLLYWGKDGQSGSPRVKMFLDPEKKVVPRSVWAASEVSSTQLAMLEQKILHEVPFGTPKPELLLSQITQIATNATDLVLDSFLGSGTTAAVAQKMGRRYIGIELGGHAVTHCVPRMRKVIDGEQGGISKAVGWQGGGGFRFYRLGAEVFDEAGRIREGIGFALLAAHVWFSETRTPWGSGDASTSGGKQVLRFAQDDTILKVSGEAEEKQVLRVDHPSERRSLAGDPGVAQDDTISVHDNGQDAGPVSKAKTTPLLGVHEGTAYFLLYNGVLGDRRPRGGNVLTRAVLEDLRQLLADGFSEAERASIRGWVVYGESARVSAGTLKGLRIVFKQTPYDVRAR